MFTLQLSLVSTQLKMDGLRSAQIDGLVLSPNNVYIGTSNPIISAAIAKKKNVIQVEMNETTDCSNLVEAFRFRGYFDEKAIRDFYQADAPSWCYLSFLDGDLFLTIDLNIENKLGREIFDHYILYAKQGGTFIARHYGFRSEHADVPAPTEKQFLEGMPFVLSNARIYFKHTTEI